MTNSRRSFLRVSAGSAAVWSAAASAAQSAAAGRDDLTIKEVKVYVLKAKPAGQPA